MYKRTRLESVSDSAGESNHAGPSAPKRPRHDATASDNRETPQDLASEEDVDGGEDSASFASLDMEALEDRVRAQIDAERLARAGRLGAVAQMGIIESVEMYEFMCHKHLSFEFGDKFNFVIGRNGSGKSAVLTALTVALGGRALSTGRGNGLKSFIREGQRVSEVTVTLRNEGFEAYKPEIYGKKILITRHFTAAGSSSYKILSEKKAVVSHRRAELDEICDHMNIQVDNPLNILTQDAARKFLSATNSKDKYTLFLKGTLLQQLSDDYDLIYANTKIIKNALTQRKADLPDMLEILQQAQREYEDALNAEKLRTKQVELRTELAWAHCYDKKQELSNSYKAVAASESRMTKIQGQIDASKQQVAAISAQIEVLNNDHDEAVEAVKQLGAQRESTRQGALAKRRELKEVQSNEREMNSTLSELNKSLERLQAQLAEESEKLEQNSQTQRDHFQTRIHSHKERITALETRQQAIDRERHSFASDLTVVEHEENEARNLSKSLQKKAQDVEEELRTSETQQRDRHSAFGNNLPAVQQAIKNTRWYGRKPIGPLGMYVQLDDPDIWGDVLRITMGHQMRSFAITEAKDYGPLKAILKRYDNASNSIIITKVDMFNYSHGEPPAEFLTPLRACKITDEFVQRILINSSSIERTYLAHSRLEAEKLMDRRGHGVVLTKECFRVTRYQEDGGKKSEALPLIHFRDLRHRIFRDSARGTEINKLQEEIRNYHKQGREALGKVKQCQQRRIDITQSISQCQSQGRLLGIELNKEKMLLEEVEAEAVYEAPVAIAALEQNRKETEDEKTDLLQQFADLQTTKLRLETELEPIQSQMVDLQSQVNDADQRREQASQRLEEEAGNHAGAIHTESHYKDELSKETAKRDALQDVANTVEFEFKDWTTKASKIGKEVNTTRPVDVIQREHDALRKGLDERDRNQLKSAETLRKEAESKRKAHKTAKDQLRSMTTLFKALENSLIIRRAKWGEFRAHMTARCRFNFQYHLSMRGYYGKAIFCHETETLALAVQTDDQIATGGKKNPETLSGGEKSFSTLCLLLALWETISCPIRCLDEFDVFMDEVNRKTSVKMLISAAKESQGKQYILITPLSLDPRIIEPWVTIRKMDDPERRRETS